MQRRQFCKAAATGIIGTVAFGTGTGTVAGARQQGVISTRDHFEYPYWGDEPQLTDENTETNYETSDVPGYDTDSTDELVIAVHGYNVGEDDAVGFFEDTTDAIAADGYEVPVSGYSWDSDPWLTDWWRANQVGEENGPKLANFIRNCNEVRPSLEIRLVGHSLGSRIILEALQTLEDRKWDGSVESVALLGAAVSDDAPETYADAIENRAGRIDNFHSDQDDVLWFAYGAAEFGTALGLYGAVGETPTNYTDHEVNEVPNHFAYNTDADGCIPAVIETWQ